MHQVIIYKKKLQAIINHFINIKNNIRNVKKWTLYANLKWYQMQFDISKHFLYKGLVFP